ncbi:MAG: NADH-ubiquinone oxidoreductase-F iron-sulfur binding region domain-containing protein [Nitrospinota bacterium]
MEVVEDQQDQAVAAEQGQIKITVCKSLSGIAEGAEEVYAEFEKQISEMKANATLGDKNCQMAQVGCRGYCSRDVLVDVYVPGEDRVTYEKVKPAMVKNILNDHIVGGKPFKKAAAKPDYYETLDMQTRVALAHGGSIDPENIDDYIKVGGYESLKKVLSTMKPEEVIAEVKKSGLRGKGGGGFVTANKWEKARNAPTDENGTRYIMVNGDEGNPASYMDRSVMEGASHQVLEGLIIGAYAIGATEAIIYTRSDYAIAVKRLNMAIEAAKERGFLGDNILGSGFGINVRVHEGLEAFIGGESTALMQSVEGKRPFPKAQPPQSCEKGLWGKPTVLNNAETWATVPKIIEKGADWYAGMGNDNANGCKIWAISGNIKYNGLMELDMKTTFREAIDDYCGGIQKKKDLKVVHVGGVTGGFLPPEKADTPTDYESLLEAGVLMGQASFAAYDESACVIDLAKFSIGFNEGETCGKCTPCRIGLTLIRQKLDDISEGRGKMEDLDKLQQLCEEISMSSLCGLGETAPKAILTGLKYFRKEYERHIVDQVCDAARCTGLYRYVVKEEDCVACGACIKPCPTGAITGGTRKVAAHIDMDLCINCNACYQACGFLAIA